MESTRRWNEWKYSAGCAWWGACGIGRFATRRVAHGEVLVTLAGSLLGGLLMMRCLWRWAVRVVVKDVAIGAGGHEFDFTACQIGHRVATAAMLLWSCIAQALSREANRNVRPGLFFSKFDFGQLTWLSTKISVISIFFGHVWSNKTTLNEIYTSFVTATQKLLWSVWCLLNLTLWRR